jgi:hypothetical protein
MSGAFSLGNERRGVGSRWSIVGLNIRLVAEQPFLELLDADPTREEPM